MFLKYCKPLTPGFRHRCRAIVASLILVSSTVAPTAAGATTAQTEILWDRWGTPHIYASSSEEAFRAFGWAQTQSHGNLLLRLLAQARGRAAEYLGPDYLASDQDTRLLAIPQDGERLYNLQSPKFKTYLTAFADGINTYAAQNPGAIDDALEAVLPVSAIDIAKHIYRDQADVSSSDCSTILSGLTANTVSSPVSTRPSSNAWAIGPSRSASGKAMLLTNPHLPWAGKLTTYEAQIVVPSEGIDNYGATLVGLPILTFAFNNFLGWTHTSNPIDTCDLYRMTLSADSQGYQFNGAVVPFQTRVETIQVKQPDGSLSAQPFTIRTAIQGPVKTTADGTFAIRSVSLGEFLASGAAEQWWDMGRARNLGEFEAALSRVQIPNFYVVYADRDGNTLGVFNGRLPVRPSGDWNFWQLPVPGDTSALLWNAIHPYSDLPKVLNPPSGWVQNSNSAPWYLSMPGPDPAAYPAYFAPSWQLSREQRGIHMLTNDTSISFKELVDYKHSTYSQLADRVLVDLLTAARQSPGLFVREAADLLEGWNGNSDASNREALLFNTWSNLWVNLTIQQYLAQGGQLPTSGEFLDFVNGSTFHRIPFSSSNILTTPQGLADPQLAVRALGLAAAQVRKRYGRIDVPWGSVARLNLGTFDGPGNGGSEVLGIFRRFDFPTGEDGRLQPAASGESYVAAVEFSDPIQAQVLNTYGNASQPGSPHIGDQLVFAAKKQLRTAWRTRAEVEANLESRQVFER